MPKRESWCHHYMLLYLSEPQVFFIHKLDFINLPQCSEN